MIHEPSEDKRGEWSRIISVRITEDQYKALKSRKIKLAPYIRELIKTLITNETKGMKVWKKR